MIIETIKEALIKNLGIDPDLIKPEARVQDDLELDSTETVVISLELKKKYGINFEFPIQDISIQEICSKVEKLLQDKVTV